MTTYLPPSMLSKEDCIAMARDLGLPDDYFLDDNYKNPEYLAKLGETEKALHKAREARLPRKD